MDKLETENTITELQSEIKELKKKVGILESQMSSLSNLYDSLTEKKLLMDLKILEADCIGETVAKLGVPMSILKGGRGSKKSKRKKRRSKNKAT